MKTITPKGLRVSDNHSGDSGIAQFRGWDAIVEALLKSEVIKLYRRERIAGLTVTNDGVYVETIFEKG